VKETSHPRKVGCRALFIFLLILSGLAGPVFSADAPSIQEKTLMGPDQLTITMRMEGPSTADTPLQVVCYFKHKPAGDKTMGAAVELDKDLGGAITSLRKRGEFTGDALETLLLTPPAGTIKAKRLLLIGLGDEESLSLERMEQVGRVALREAAKLGVPRATFAPLLRDQGDSRYAAGEVARAVLRGVILAYDTDRRLQKEGLAKEFVLEQWAYEAGAKYFDETIAAAQRAIGETETAIAARSSEPYRSAKP
jgi:hypothetical protein